MKTTLDFIADVKAKYAITSDYAAAKLLGVSKMTMSHYRTGKGMLGDDSALKVAELLEIEPGYVLACIAAERSKDAKVKKVWAWTAQHLGGLAAALAVLAVLPFVPGMEADSLSGGTDGLLGFALLAGFTSSNSVYYVKCSIWGYLVGFATAVVLLSHSSAERLRRTVSGFAAQTDRD